ncbi:hypothetical protein FHX37_0058 [Haloactinospora alba]|uniref:Uncharacterized protein n=1 Tax=Haloactinospora alba TaxID=405555 RepID=A0A543NEC2_9ACTN|nr:hypothetical protein [Haloactinospora alba]TQN30197.1 hypothetical protein FHX37_0058 [Haloactinospora alba]
MSKENRTWVAAGAAAAAVVVLSAVFAGWWALLWAPALLALVGIPALLFHLSRHEDPVPVPVNAGPAQEHHVAADASPAPQRKHLSQVPLPSAHQDYDFLFSAVVHWRAHAPLNAGTQGMATSLVLDRAGTLTRGEAPEEYGVVRHRVSAALGEVIPLEQGMLEVWAEDVRVELREEDAQRLNRIRDLRKDEELREQEREVERSQRNYLGNDVLADPGQAVVWWLSRDSQRIDETVDRIGTLSRLSAAASGNDIPRLYRELVAELAGSGDLGDGPDGMGTGPGSGAGAFSTGGPGSGPRDGGDGASAEREDDPLDLLRALVATMTSGAGGYEEEQVVDQLAVLLEGSGLSELARRFRESYAVDNAWEEEEPPLFDVPPRTGSPTAPEDSDAREHGDGSDTAQRDAEAGGAEPDGSDDKPPREGDVSELPSGTGH